MTRDGPRPARAEDAPEIARLLDAFNREFDEFTPGVEVLERNVRELIEDDGATFLLTGSFAVAALRFRRSIWTDGRDAYLEELYVAPQRRGRGLGRALLEAAMQHARERGAAHIDLNTSVDDVAARSLYESAGFTNHEGGREGPMMLYYERDL